jgi:hypothetical protein
MVVGDGYIGSDPAFRTRARLVMEANADVAGMHQQLYYPVDEGYDPAARDGVAGGGRSEAPVGRCSAWGVPFPVAAL